MRQLLMIFLMTILTACSNDTRNQSQPPKEKTHHKLMPDRIHCTQSDSNYELILILKDPKLPTDITAIGLKKGAATVFKVATQKYFDENHVLSFIEIPATNESKEVKFYPEEKVAKLLNFHTEDLVNNSVFTCQY